MHWFWIALSLYALWWAFLGQAYSEATEDRVQFNMIQNQPDFDVLEVRYLWPKNFAEYRLVFDAPALDPRQYQIITRFNRKTREIETRPPVSDQGKPMTGEPKNEILVARDLVRPKGRRPEVVSIVTRFSFPKGTDLRAKMELIEPRKTLARGSSAFMVWSNGQWRRP